MAEELERQEELDLETANLMAELEGDTSYAVAPDDKDSVDGGESESEESGASQDVTKSQDGSPQGDAGSEGGAEAKQEETVESLKAKLEAERAERVRFQQQYGRQANELGELRKVQKAIEERIAARKGQDQHKRFVEDPQGYQQDILDQAQDQRRLEELDRYAKDIRARERVAINQSLAAQWMPDLNDRLNDMADIARKDGFPEQEVQGFLQNPHAANQFLVYQLYQRANAVSEVTRLQKELVEYRKRNKDVLSKAEQAAKKGPGVTGRSGGSIREPGAPVDEATVRNMSDEEFDKYFAEQMK